jgi:CheY-like chemotaxis protein
MANENVWIFIDDRKEDAEIFAEKLESTGLIKIEVMSPAFARIELLQNFREPAGVLMDVDLSAIAGELGTGPGIAQDIRTKQKARNAREFPIIRFSAADPTARNITGDPSSDDLFELKVLKEFVKVNPELIASQLIGAREVYDSLIDISTNIDHLGDRANKLFGVNNGAFPTWIHEGLLTRVLTGATHAPHVAANIFFRLFLMPTGLLIDRSVLSVRLGISENESGDAWLELLTMLNKAKYSGAGAASFERWWTRGVDDWWFDTIDKSAPLSGKTASERVDLITNKTGLTNLRAIQSKAALSDTRFWRHCKLALEKMPPEYIPVDPSDSVRIISQSDLSSWIEPFSASPKLAFQNKSDPRLNQKDLARLRKKYGV